MVVFAIPQVDAFIIALVLALFLWASSTLFGTFVRGLASSVPFIGSYIFDTQTWIGQWILGQVASWIQWGITPFGNAIGGTVASVDSWIIQTFNTLSNIVAAVVNSAAGAVSQSIQAAIDALGNAISAARTDLTYAINAAQQAAINTAQSLVGDLRAELAGIESNLSSIISTVNNNVQTLLSQQAANVEAELANAVHVAEQAAVSIEAGLQDRINGAVASIDGAVNDRIDALLGTVTGEGAVTAGRIATLEGEIAGVTAQAATIAAVATATAATLATEIAECITPLCDTFHGDVPLVADAINALESGLVMAFLIYALRDPDGAAGAALATVSGPVRDTASLVESIF